MEHKGYLTESGRVVQRRADITESMDGERIVAQVLYTETRYNLRRVLVTRDWIVRSLDGARSTSGETRREATARYLGTDQ